MSEKWRFPGNNNTTDQGLDTADMETFKKDAISSLARELCQNSIDAKRKNANGPVKMVFKSFEISKYDIPQRDSIVAQIEACQQTWSKQKKISTALSKMHDQINKDKIVCLRISDFNTTGLIGVESGEDNTPWHYLVHGSGLSDKGETSGGSKGIGKFATFVASHFNTVFYSTKTENGEEGYQGICKLCSAKIPGEKKQKTLGIGYFGSDEENDPIKGQLVLDPTYKRTESGTDIYIIGFKNDANWKRDIISKILESFISAIAFGTLEVEIDGTILDKDHLMDVVFDEDLIKKDLKKSIVSQFLLLTDKDRTEDRIDIEGYGDATLYLLEMSGENEEFATNNVVMIRYPYMKIKCSPKMSTIPCAAMLIIGDNNLNKILRDVENPQHTDWEFNRIDDEAQKAEVKGIYNDLLEKIRRNIADHLSSSDNTQTDLEGAGDYLPGVDEQPSKRPEGEKKVVKDKPKLQKEIRSKKPNLNASIEDENGDGVLLDISGQEGEEETIAPEGENKGKGGPVKPGETPKTGGTGEDGSVIVKQAELRSMQYYMMCLNKTQGKYLIVFTSDYTEDDATISLNALDEGGNKYPVKILDATINGSKAELEDDYTIKLVLKHGDKYKIEMATDQKELFSGEVKVYAYRK